jgi:hypothetical protein
VLSRSHLCICLNKNCHRSKLNERGTFSTFLNTCECTQSSQSLHIRTVIFWVDTVQSGTNDLRNTHLPSSEKRTSVSIYQAAHYHMPQNYNMNLHYREIPLVSRTGTSRRPATAKQSSDKAKLWILLCFCEISTKDKHCLSNIHVQGISENRMVLRW